MEGFQKITTEAMTFYFCYFKNVMIIDNEWVIIQKKKCFNEKKISVYFFMPQLFCCTHPLMLSLFTSLESLNIH